VVFVVVLMLMVARCQTLTGEQHPTGSTTKVHLEGKWVNVPDEAVIIEPNRAGHTMVWPYYLQGEPIIRCFLPGAMI